MPIVNKSKEWIYCLAGIVLCFSSGVISGLSSGSGDSLWYRNLIKPSFNPPSWVFAPTWTLLYIMMGIALGIIWKDRKNNRILLFLFALQLIFNLMWSPIFFLFHRIEIALYDLVLLWVTIMIFLYFARRLHLVFILFLPYALWVSFAFILNLNIYLLNN